MISADVSSFMVSIDHLYLLSSFLISLDKSLSIVLIVLKNKLLISLIFSIFLFFISLICVLIFIVFSLLVHVLNFACNSFFLLMMNTFIICMTEYIFIYILFFSFAVSDLLLSPSSVFFILDIVFFHPCSLNSHFCIFGFFLHHPLASLYLLEHVSVLIMVILMCSYANYVICGVSVYVPIDCCFSSLWLVCVSLLCTVAWKLSCLLACTERFL